jgi:pilus assembly protein CpaC
MFLHQTNPRSTRSWLSALAIGLALAAFSPAAGHAQQQTQLSISDYGQTRVLEVEMNKSMLLDLPADVSEVIVSRPSVAGAIMRTTRRAIIQGVDGGSTNILFLDNQGRPIAVIDLKVAKERSQVGAALEGALARIIPGSAIRVDSVTLGGETNRVVLSGTVLSGDDATRAIDIATQFAGGADNVASVIDVAGAQQVMLRVTVSEVQREVAKQLGINLSGTVTIGSASFGFNNQMSELGNGVSGSFGLDNLQIDAAVRALEERGALRVLAQPTLTAISGETADFLAGGEIRYLSGYDDDGNPIYQFRDYGVSLEFTPTVKSNGTIGLLVKTGVSEPETDLTLTKREASTSVELPAGTTLAIGGLLDERTSQAIAQLPGLGNIPILGALFRSRDYRTSQTELVILVTPYLVKSTHGPVEIPTDRNVVASDAEAIFLGKLESAYGVGGSASMRGGFNGSVGFVLD